MTMLSHRTLLISVCIGVVLIITGACLVALWPDFFDMILNKKLALSPDSYSYNLWASMPVPLYIRFYFFNCTNPDQVVQGSSKPVLQEIGPYVFREHHQKVNIDWHDNDTVTYEQIKSWNFVAEESESLDDVVTTLNVPLVGAAYFLRYKSSFVRISFDIFASLMGEELFVRKKVRQFLFEGYTDPLLDVAALAKYAIHLNIPYDKFGWFYGRNNTYYNDGVNTIFRGQHDISKLGKLDVWNQTKATSFYPSPCNMLNGSAGDFFPPHPTKTAIAMYSTDVCRSLTLKYKEEMVHDGLNAYRYWGDPGMFATPDINPDNWCYCNGECPVSGLLNSSSCRYNTPAFVSFPHFLFADQLLLDAVEGLHPDVEKHQLYIDLEQLSGVPLAVAARFQINVMLENIPNITPLKNIANRTYFPMIWFEETAGLTPDMASELRMVMNVVPTVLSVVSYLIVSVGATLFVVIGIYFCAIRRQTTPPGPPSVCEKHYEFSGPVPTAGGPSQEPQKF